MLLEDISAYLEQQGLGTVGVDIYRGDMPDAPDECIALYEQPGQAPEQNWDAERPGLTVRVRSVDRGDAASRAYAVWKALNGLTNAALNGTEYHRIDASSSIAQAGRDGKRRHYYICNFSVIKEVE